MATTEGRQEVKVEERHIHAQKHRIVAPLARCRQTCTGQRGTIYCVGGIAVACSPADGEVIQDRTDFSAGQKIKLGQLVCQQCRPGENRVKITFEDGKSRTFHQAALAVHVSGLTIGDHRSVVINTMALMHAPTCIHCLQPLDLTGAKTPVLVGNKGLLCDKDCEDKFLAVNPGWRKIVASLTRPHQQRTGSVADSMVVHSSARG